MRYCPKCFSAYPDRTSGTCPRDGVMLVGGAEYAAIRSDALIGTTLVDAHRQIAPLRKATEQAEVGDTSVFLLSSMSRGITGEVIYVDDGYHILGALAPV